MNNKQRHETLPWYVNGSVSAEERADMEQALAESGELRSDEEFLSALRQKIQNETHDSPGEFGLQRLRRDIKNESKPMPQNKWRAFSIAASLALAVLLGSTLNLSRDNDTYVPLSGGDYQNNIIQIQFKPTATVNSVNDLLLKMGATVIDGPSAKNIYRIRLKTVDDKILRDIRQSNNIVDFVAEE